MSDRDESAADARAAAEYLIQSIIDLRQEDPSMTGKQIAKQIGWPLGRTQAVLARLVKHNVIEPAGPRRGSRQKLIDLIDEKYGPKKKTK